MGTTTRCPRSQTEIKLASEKLKCKNDTYGNNQYMCLPNEEKSSLVEFCFEGTMGIELKGSCLEVYGGKQINRYSCSKFSHGCPDTDFYKYNMHKYPRCQEINTEFHCYVAEPRCSDQITSNSNGISAGIGIGIGVAIGVAILIVLTIIAVMMCKRRRRKSNQKKETLTKNQPKDPATLTENQPKDPATLTENQPKDRAPLTENKHGYPEPVPNQPENVAGIISYTDSVLGDLRIHGKDHNLALCKVKGDNENKEVELKFQDSMTDVRSKARELTNETLDEATELTNETFNDATDSMTDVRSKARELTNETLDEATELTNETFNDATVSELTDDVLQQDKISEPTSALIQRKGDKIVIRKANRFDTYVLLHSVEVENQATSDTGSETYTADIEPLLGFETSTPQKEDVKFQ